MSFPTHNYPIIVSIANKELLIWWNYMIILEVFVISEVINSQSINTRLTTDTTWQKVIGFSVKIMSFPQQFNNAWHSHTFFILLKAEKYLNVLDWASTLFLKHSYVSTTCILNDWCLSVSEL